jgi:hypothetical protein
MAVEVGATGIDPQAGVEYQLCVPPVEMNGESYRLAQSKRRRRTFPSPADPPAKAT